MGIDWWGSGGLKTTPHRKYRSVYLINMPILNFAAKRGFFRRQGVLSYACYWGGTDTILNLILPLHRTPPLLTIPKMWGLHECLSTVSLASLGNRNASQSLFPLPLKWHGRPGSDNKPLYCAFHEACQRSADLLQFCMP